jgi:integrase
MAELTSKASPPDCIFGKAGSKSCKSESADGSAGISPLCPQCVSQKVWRDGLRYPMFGDQIQRWICRDCGLRFSDPKDVEKAWSTFERIERIESKSLKSTDDKDSTRQICVSETKNLVAEQQKMEVPQRNEADLKSAIVNFLWKMQKDNRSSDTIRVYGYSLRQLVNAGVDLFNPESFLDKMALLTWPEKRKYSLAKAYRSFLKANKIEAELPTYKFTRPLPYVPCEEFLDQLIACCGVQMAAFLQTLKETGARPGEAWRIEWNDIDIENRKIHISQPEKGCNARLLRITPKLLNMLLALPRDSKRKRIFSYKSRDMAWKTFSRMRQKAIRKLGNEELRKIDFYTFRYWRATMEYRRLHDFGAVMILLGHKSLKYVLLYAQLSDSYDLNGGYVCKEATNRVEAKQLIEDGFEYVMDKDGVSLFRKLK